jgi:hypothetical protein
MLNATEMSEQCLCGFLSDLITRLKSNCFRIYHINVSVFKIGRILNGFESNYFGVIYLNKFELSEWISPITLSFPCVLLKVGVAAVAQAV